MRHHVLLLPVTIALSAPALAAQFTGPGLHRIVGPPLWQTSLPQQSTQFGGICVGKFMSPWDPDAAVLRGNELHLAVAMASRNRAVLLTTGVNEMLRLPGQGFDGLDALLTTSSGGVKVWMSPEGGGVPTATIWDQLAGWDSVTTLRLGANNIYGLSGSTVLVASLAGSPLGSITLSVPAADICPLDFDGNGQEDLAVAYNCGTTNTIEVRLASTGQVIWSPLSNQYLNNHIAASKGHGNEPDFLFWYGEFSGYPLICALNAQRTDPLQVAPEPCGGLATFDFDDAHSSQDPLQRDDVLFSGASTAKVFVFHRHDVPSGSTFTYNPSPDAETPPVDTFAPSEEGVVPPILVAGGDIDNDGDNDPLFALQGRSLLRSPLNGRIERGSLAPAVSYMELFFGTNESLLLEVLYQKSALLPTATNLEIEVSYLDGSAHLVTTYSSGLPGSGTGVADVVLPVLDLDHGALQLIMREKGPLNGTTASYPTKTYFYYWTEDGAQLVFSDYEMVANSGTGALNPTAPGYTQGSGGQGP